MLRQFPRTWNFHPDRPGKTQDAALTGSGGKSRPIYLSTWVLRKHMFGQLREAWPPADTVDAAWLRSWCLDSNDRLGDFEDSLTLDVLEIKAGRPYREITMWLCLVGPLMKMHRHVTEFMCDPQNCLRFASPAEAL